MYTIFAIAVSQMILLKTNAKDEGVQNAGLATIRAMDD